MVPAKEQAVSDATEGGGGGGGRGSGAGGKGGGAGAGGKGKRTKSAPSNIFIAGLAAVVATTPLVGLSAKAQSDPKGFQTTLRDALPPALAEAIIVQFLPKTPAAKPDAPEKPAAAPAKRAPPPPAAAAPGSVVMALPAALASGTPEKMLQEAKAAAEQQWEQIQAAAAATLARARAAKEVDAAARRKVEEELRAEMGLLEKERGMLAEEALALREALRASVAPEEQPQVIFQEVVAPWQQIRHKLDDAAAESLAAKVASALRTQAPQAKQYDPIDLSKEGALASGAELAAVQKRVKEVLMELDARVRVENSRLRDAIRQTEEAIKADLAQMADKQLQAQQVQLKEYMDAQTQAMAQAASTAVKKRNQTYTAYLSELFDAASNRAEEFAAISARLLAGLFFFLARLHANPPFTPPIPAHTYTHTQTHAHAHAHAPTLTPIHAPVPPLHAHARSGGSAEERLGARRFAGATVWQVCAAGQLAHPDR